MEFFGIKGGTQNVSMVPKMVLKWSMVPKRRNWYVLFTETGFSPDILNRFGQPQLRSIRCHQEANGTNKVSMLPIKCQWGTESVNGTTEWQ
jgi:hypothetical protein